MTSKRPWYPWYPADYRADTVHLTHLEHAVYRELIDYVWEHECLPGADDLRMSLIVRLSVKRWRAIKATILAFFTEDFRHKRIDFELQKAQQISSKRSASARAKASAIAAKKSANGGAIAPANAEITRARDRATLHTSQKKGRKGPSRGPLPSQALTSEVRAEPAKLSADEFVERATKARLSRAPDEAANEAAAESRRVALLATARDAPAPTVVIDEGLQPIGGALDAKLEALGQLIRSQPKPKERRK